MRWIEALTALREIGESSVLLTVLSVDGSAPREQGAKMVVTSGKQFDTIGGGNLEYQAIHDARKILVDSDVAIVQKTYSLGQDLSQCCGGRVTVLFEIQQGTAAQIAVFGAGHVGRALVDILAKLDCRVAWYDSREDWLPPEPPSGSVTTKLVSNNTICVEQCRPDTAYLIMTHSHEDDFELVEAVLSRNDARFCGLIASESKAASFRSRLVKKQFSETEVALLTAPVGYQFGESKEPMAVAVSIVAQLLDRVFGPKS